ncbi:MAG: C40 family peptidase [Deltaproteobacteria bacterium]|nr:C40 family peptidase [Deltaproteobacteria bacterium]
MVVAQLTLCPAPRRAGRAGKQKQIPCRLRISFSSGSCFRFRFIVNIFLIFSFSFILSLISSVFGLNSARMDVALASAPPMRGLDLPRLLAQPTTQFLAVVFHSSATIDAHDRLQRWRALRTQYGAYGLVVVFVVPGAPGAGCERVDLEDAKDHVVCDEFAVIARSFGLAPTSQPGNAYAVVPRAFLWSKTGALSVATDDTDAIERILATFVSASASSASSVAPVALVAPQLPSLTRRAADPTEGGEAWDRARSLATLERLRPTLLTQGAADLAAYADRAIRGRTPIDDVGSSFDGAELIRDAYAHLFGTHPGSTAEIMWQRGIEIFIDPKSPDRTLRPGDLIFVRSETGQILRTGIYLGEGLMLSDLLVRGVQVTSIWPTAPSLTSARRRLRVDQPDYNPSPQIDRSFEPY